MMVKREELTENFGVTLKHMAEQSYKPMTNGDRIRAMSDERLATLFTNYAKLLFKANNINAKLSETFEADALRTLKKPREVET